MDVDSGVLVVAPDDFIRPGRAVRARFLTFDPLLRRRFMFLGRSRLLRVLTLAACLSPVAVTAGDLRGTTVADSARPQYGAWGFDSAGADFAIRPGEDFFGYANGTWLAKTAIPGDKPGYSLRLQMTDRTEARLHEILEKAAANVPREPRTLEGKAGAFYASFMDEARIEQMGERRRSHRSSRRCVTPGLATRSRRSWVAATSTSSRPCSPNSSTSTSRIRRAMRCIYRSRVSGFPTAIITWRPSSRRPRPRTRCM